MLDYLPPDDGRVVIAHEDFRLGNMLFHPEKGEVIGILDWEQATLGHPLADVAFCCIPWRSTPILQSYTTGAGRSQARRRRPPPCRLTIE
ncbi:MAG: phosphotransferase [Bradyrhizobiaceae bacterium]|nr:phosphotransferase [Bradyrhizobiaceae bacterium]